MANRLGWVRPLPFRRIERAPGEEAQVDFGTGAPIIDTAGKRHKTHVFRIVLSHSRKAYSEVTYRQTTEIAQFGTRRSRLNRTDAAHRSTRSRPSGHR